MTPTTLDCSTPITLAPIFLPCVILVMLVILVSVGSRPIDHKRAGCPAILLFILGRDAISLDGITILSPLKFG